MESPTMVLMMFLLMATTPQAETAPPTPPKTEDTDQKVRCKKEEVTGSLVGRRKICHTVAEWRQINGNAVDTAQTLVDRGTLQPTRGE